MGVQPAPPHAAVSMIALLRLATAPTPHPGEQVPHAAHSVRTQSTGQGAELHAPSSVSAPQAAPPAVAAAVMTLERIVDPVPHDLEQTAHPLQLPTTQSAGQLFVLQTLWSDSSGQRAPLPCGDFVMLLARVFCPVPHESVHALQLAQLDAAQSTGHSKMLQSFSS